MYNIICSNISENSDAYTSIKPCINDSNGRLYMVNLKGHFNGNVANQVLGRQATVNCNKIFYRSERQMCFEASSPNLQTLLMTRRELVGPWVIHTLLMVSRNFKYYQLYHYNIAFQVQQSLNPRVWDNILDTLSVRISKLRISKPIRNIYYR